MSTRFLEGVRVLELGGFWAAPYCCGLLADMGAQVIKVEDTQNPPLREAVQRENGAKVLEGIPWFKAMNRNKLGCAVNLRDGRGISIVKRLASVSDVLVENFSPPGRRSLGIDYSDVATLCPKLVYVSLSGFGSTGPGSALRAYGPTLEAMSGMSSILGYSDGPPTNMGVAFTDPLSGVQAAGLAIAGLLEARGRGEGLHIDLSQLELAVSSIPGAILDFAWNARVHEREANSGSDSIVSGVYPCNSDDTWVALTIHTDVQLAEFRSLLTSDTGISPPQADEAVASGHTSGELDDLIAHWSIKHDPESAAALLRARRIPAAAVLKVDSLVRDAHLSAREMFVEVDGELIYSAPYAVSTGPRTSERPPIVKPAPRLGEHDQYIFEELLQIPSSELNELRRSGVLLPASAGT